MCKHFFNCGSCILCGEVYTPPGFVPYDKLPSRMTDAEAIREATRAMWRKASQKYRDKKGGVNHEESNAS
jgi:hypothetical protein